MKFKKSKSYSNFKRRELSQTEKSLLDKYNKINNKDINNNEKKSKINLKLDFINNKKIIKVINNIRNTNQDFLKIKHIDINNINDNINNNYFNSIIINKKSKEYYQNLYNNENIDINNINLNPKNILSKTKKILGLSVKNYSYNNIFNNTNTNYEKNLNLNSDIYNSNNTFDILYTNNSINNHKINNYFTKSTKNYNFSSFYQKKIVPKKIKNKIVYRAVNILKKKRNNNKSETKNFNNFNFSYGNKALKLDKNENKNKSTWIQYSSIMTDLINKNKNKNKFFFN